MKKSERLNDMMMFLNNKNSFNIKDIMERYHISRSSAIRDIKSLEELGMPIYSKSGRNGSYKILPNRLLSPIVFTIDEVYSLYFAMLTLSAYQSTPFHLSVEKLKLKFEKCLSEEQIHALHKMETVFRLNTVEHSNSSTCLKDILKMAIKESPCIIEYKKQDIHEYTVQFFDISSAFGQWYGTAYNFETEKIQVFRCDRIQSVNATALFKGKPIEEFKRPADKLYKDGSATEFQVTVSEKGVDLFYKEHYPSMQLCSEMGCHVIKGFYNRVEQNFIADYFIHYGDNLLKVEPAKLKLLITDRLNNLLQKYERF